MNDLPTCPGCGRRHLPIATRCPHCGQAFFRDPFEDQSYEPRARLRPAVLVGGLLVVVAGVGLWAVSRQGPLGPVVRPERVARPQAMPVDTPPAAAPTGQPLSPEQPPTAPPVRPRPAPDPETPATTTRWASTWANVREAPSINSPVVTILNPGERVEVGERDRGYWRVYEGGRPVGYVAGSLLLTEPP